MRAVKILFLVTLFTFALGQLSRVELSPKVVIFLSDLLIPLLTFIFLIYNAVNKRKIFLPSFSLPLFLFILAALFSLLLGSLKLATEESLISGLFLVRLVEYVCLSLVGYNLFLDQKFSNLTVKILIIIGLLVSLLGFVQVLVLPDFSQLAAQGGWDPHQYRLLSTFFDPNFVGGFLVMILSFVFAHLLFKPKFSEKVALGVFGLAITIAVILTLSRSTYLAFFTMLGTFALVRSRKIFLSLLLLGTILFISIPAVLDRLLQAVNFDDSSLSRITSWRNALTIFKDEPLFGVGFNAYRFTQEDYGFFKAFEDGGHAGSGTDSSILLVLATTGIVGLVVWLVFLASLGKTAFRKRQKKWSLAFLTSLTSLLVHSLFVNSLFYPPILGVFLVGAALMSAEKDD